jgi:hypothetical protein
VSLSSHEVEYFGQLITPEVSPSEKGRGSENVPSSSYMLSGASFGFSVMDLREKHEKN